MTGDEPEQRTESGCFEACGVGNRQVDAGAETLVENLSRGANLLSGFFE
ncbi:hypothetical protein [Rhodococcus pyridinivorans]|nr:hypothetical protein [Rhodococcus pyridinivorans]